jgi:hypothetical protein
MNSVALLDLLYRQQETSRVGVTALSSIEVEVLRKWLESDQAWLKKLAADLAGSTGKTSSRRSNRPGLLTERAAAAPADVESAVESAATRPF